MRRARAGGAGGGGAGSAGSGAGGDGGGAEEVHKARAGRGGAEEATPAGLAAVARELQELRAAVTKAHAEKPGAETAEALAAVDAAMTVPVAVAGAAVAAGDVAGSGRRRRRCGSGSPAHADRARRGAAKGAAGAFFKGAISGRHGRMLLRSMLRPAGAASARVRAGSGTSLETARRGMAPERVARKGRWRLARAPYGHVDEHVVQAEMAVRPRLQVVGAGGNAERHARRTANREARR